MPQFANSQPLESPKVRRKAGRIPQLQAARSIHIMLEDDLIEWGKGQPGGLSQIVREFLRAKKGE
jgi:hypothetical protein